MILLFVKFLKIGQQTLLQGEDPFEVLLVLKNYQLFNTKAKAPTQPAVFARGNGHGVRIQRS